MVNFIIICDCLCILCIFSSYSSCIKYFVNSLLFGFVSVFIRCLRINRSIFMSRIFTVYIMCTWMCVYEHDVRVYIIIFWYYIKQYTYIGSCAYCAFYFNYLCLLARCVRVCECLLQYYYHIYIIRRGKHDWPEILRGTTRRKKILLAVVVPRTPQYLRFPSSTFISLPIVNQYPYYILLLLSIIYNLIYNIIFM